MSFKHKPEQAVGFALGHWTGSEFLSPVESEGEDAEECRQRKVRECGSLLND
jgi:hypothetical protein